MAQPTESSAGGTLLYVRNPLSYKVRKDLNFYRFYELESIFVKILTALKRLILLLNLFINIQEQILMN